MMSIYQVAVKNVLRKKTRTLLTVLGISLSVWVLASLLGFNQGYERALNKDIDQMGFQVLVTAKGCPYEAATLMLRGGTGLRYLNDTVVKQVTSHAEVKRVTPMIMQAVFDPNKGENGGISAYLGVDPATFPAMKQYLKFKQGGWFKPGETQTAVVGYEAAELEQREIGDLILIPGKNVELKVVGVLARTGTQDDGTIFVPLELIQKVFQLKGKLTGIGVQTRQEADISALEKKLYDLPDAQVVSLAQVKQTIMSLVATAKVMVLSIALIAVLIAVLGVVNTILMSVFERFQEIGILKSMGAMPKDIFIMVWTETLMVCLAGGFLGNLWAFGLAQLTDGLIRMVLPYAPTGSMVLVNGPLVLETIGLTLVIGLVSGIYPALKAAGIRPLEAIKSGVI